MDNNTIGHATRQFVGCYEDGEIARGNPTIEYIPKILKHLNGTETLSIAERFKFLDRSTMGYSQPIVRLNTGIKDNQLSTLI